MISFARFLLPAVCWTLSLAAGAAAELKVELTDLPPPAQTAVKQLAGKGKIVELSRSSGGDSTAFNVKFTRDNRSRTFSVDAEGTLLRRQFFFAELPVPVQKAMKQHVGTGKTGKVEKVFADGSAIFEVEFSRSGRTGEFTLSEDGALLSRLVLLKEAPAAAQKTILAVAGKAVIDSIYRTYEDGEIFYRVNLTTGGKPRDFHVAADGSLVNVQVFMAELPVPVQQSVRAELGALKPGDIYRTHEEEGIAFVVEFTRNGKPRSLTVNPDGRLANLQVEFAETPAPVQQAVREQLGNEEPDEVFKTFTDGGVVYDVAASRDGRRQTLTATAEGKLREYSLEVAGDSLPAAVKQTVQQKLPGQPPEAVTRHLAEGEVYYEVVFVRNGKPLTLTVSDEGELLSEDEELPLGAVAADIQRTVKQLVGKGRLETLHRVTADTEVTYDVNLLKDGRRQRFSLDAMGKRLD